MSDWDRIPPPVDPRVEMRAAGAPLVRLTALDDMGGLLPEHFFDRSLGAVFGAAREVYARNIRGTVADVRERMESQPGFDAIEIDGRKGAAALARLRELVPTAAGADDSARTVRRYHALRELSGILLCASLEAKEGAVESVTEWWAEKQARIDALMVSGASEARGTRERMTSTTLAIMRESANPNEGCGPRTGMRGIDDMLKRGLEPGREFIVAGRPGAGKSALADQIGVAVAATGRNVLVFSREMITDETTRRQIARQAQVGAWELTHDDNADAVTEAADVLSRMPGQVFVDDQRSTLTQIRAYTRTMCRRENIGLVIVDHIGLVSHGHPSWSTQRRISELAVGFKALAMVQHVPVIVISQLNRGSEYRDDRRPMLADLRDSGELEQSADVVLAVYRPFPKDGPADEGYAEVLCLKHRSGRTGRAYLAFNGPQTRFSDVTDEQAARDAIKKIEDDNRPKKVTTPMDAGSK